MFRALCALVCLKSSVTGSCFPRVHVNVAALEGRLQSVLVPLEGSSLVASFSYPSGSIFGILSSSIRTMCSVHLLLDVPGVDGPRRATIQKRAQDHISVYGNLGREAAAVICQSLFVSRPKAALTFPKRCITSASRDLLQCS